MVTNGKSKKNALSIRMKEFYENRTRILLPRRTYTIIRIDGRSFHQYCKRLNKPFDAGLIEDMNVTAEYLCKNIQGAKCGFVQSDEISILMTDFDTLQTDAWFDGNIQKIVSVAASIATAKFNQLRMRRFFEEKELNGYSLKKLISEMDASPFKLAEFDARTFTIPSLTEVCNYFIWRQQDTVRNSISSVAQSLYSSKELHGKNMSVQQDMIHEKGQNWNDYPAMQKRGRFVFKKEIDMETEFKGKEFQQSSYKRNKWVSDECPTFTQDQDFLLGFIPDINE